MKNRDKILARLLRRSHERQFAGEDWQQVAVDLCEELPDATEDDFNFLSSGPDPGCECGFCGIAPWKSPIL